MWGMEEKARLPLMPYIRTNKTSEVIHLAADQERKDIWKSNHIKILILKSIYFWALHSLNLPEKTISCLEFFPPVNNQSHCKTLSSELQ